MREMAVDAVCLLVDDLTRSRAFYRDVIGLAELAGNPAGTPPWQDFQGGNGTLRLLQATGAGATRPAEGHDALWHVCLRVAAMEPAAARVRASGARFAIEPRTAHGGVEICFFHDPDGILLEFTAGELSYDRAPAEGGAAVTRQVSLPAIDHFAVEVVARFSAAQWLRERCGFETVGELDYSEEKLAITYLNDGRLGCELFEFQPGDEGTRKRIDVSQRWRISLITSSSVDASPPRLSRVRRDGRAAGWLA
jgi:catechol 2,3-dioxygenase-like lactoylglutathione lyase family enzyme